MSLEEFYYISQIIASFAVLASLIYLALQTRQTARNQQAAIAQARTDSLNTVVLTLSQPDVQEVFWKGMTTPDDLTLGELRQFTGLLAATFSNAENSFLQHRSGSLSDEAFETPKIGMQRFMIFKGARAYWRIRRENYGPAFRAWVDGLARDTPLMPEFDLLQQFKAAAALDNKMP